MDLLSTSRLFEQFLAQRRYLKNVTPSTIEWYETAFKALQREPGIDPQLSKSSLQSFVTSVRQRGVKPVSCNTYIKALNAFSRWLHDEGHVAQRVDLPGSKSKSASCRSRRTCGFARCCRVNRRRSTSGGCGRSSRWCSTRVCASRRR